MEQATNESQERVRMNVSTNSKGLAQIDCTVEAMATDRAKEMLSQALKAINEVLDEQGLRLAN